MPNFGETIGTIAVAIVGLAILSVLVSPQAKTSQLISTGGQAFVNALNAATGPVSMSGYGSSYYQPPPQFRAGY